jgi:hypothetical protein
MVRLPLCTVERLQSCNRLCSFFLFFSRAGAWRQENLQVAIRGIGKCPRRVRLMATLSFKPIVCTFLSFADQDFSFAACSSSVCKFTYSPDYTPYATTFTSLGGSGSHTYRAIGTLRGTAIEQYTIRQDAWSCHVDEALQIMSNSKHDYVQYGTLNANDDGILDWNEFGTIRW